MDNIETGLKAQPNGITENSKSSLEKLQERQEMVRGEILKFYISSRREIPEPVMMDAEVSIAVDDWRDIPGDILSEVCAEARRQSRGFLPANSLVLGAWDQWRAQQEKEIREEKMMVRISESSPAKKTPEEIAFAEQFFS